VDESENEIEEYNNNSEEEDEELLDTLKSRTNKVHVPPVTQVEKGDTEEVKRVKELLQGWDDDADAAEDSDDDSVERMVILKDNEIDHIVLAAPNLDDAIEEFERMCGVAPVPAHAVKGLGICCAHISFNDSSYIEIIAPDYDGEPGVIGNLIKSRKFRKLTPFHYAIRSSRLAELKKEVPEFGYTPDHITLFSGSKDGEPRTWETMYMYGHKLGGLCPYFVSWKDESIHPCRSIPVLGRLKKFHIRAPASDPVHQLFAHLKTEGICLEIGDKPKLSFQFSSPDGTVKFATSKATGYKFPGFDDEDNLNHNDSHVFSDTDLDYNDSVLSLMNVDQLPIEDHHDDELPIACLD